MRHFVYNIIKKGSVDLYVLNEIEPELRSNIETYKDIYWNFIDHHIDTADVDAFILEYLGEDSTKNDFDIDDYMNLLKTIESKHMYELYNKIIDKMIEQDNRFKVGDVLLLDDIYRSEYGIALVEYDDVYEKKIVNRDGEGDPSLSDTSIEILKNRNVTYTNANTRLAYELNVDADIIVVPIVCKRIDEQLN